MNQRCLYFEKRNGEIIATIIREPENVKQVIHELHVYGGFDEENAKRKGIFLFDEHVNSAPQDTIVMDNRPQIEPELIDTKRRT